MTILSSTVGFRMVLENPFQDVPPNDPQVEYATYDEAYPLAAWGEWLQMEQACGAAAGTDSYAFTKLGDPRFVNLPLVSKQFNAQVDATYFATVPSWAYIEYVDFYLKANGQPGGLLWRVEGMYLADTHEFEPYDGAPGISIGWPFIEEGGPIVGTNMRFQNKDAFPLFGTNVHTFFSVADPANAPWMKFHLAFQGYQFLEPPTLTEEDWWAEGAEDACTQRIFSLFGFVKYRYVQPKDMAAGITATATSAVGANKIANLAGPMTGSGVAAGGVLGTYTFDADLTGVGGINADISDDTATDNTAWLIASAEVAAAIEASRGLVAEMLAEAGLEATLLRTVDGAAGMASSGALIGVILKISLLSPDEIVLRADGALTSSLINDGYMTGPLVADGSISAANLLATLNLVGDIPASATLTPVLMMYQTMEGVVAAGQATMTATIHRVDTCTADLVAGASILAKLTHVYSSTALLENTLRVEPRDRCVPFAPDAHAAEPAQNTLVAGARDRVVQVQPRPRSIQLKSQQRN